MKKILICDDEEGVRESLKLVLSEESKYELIFVDRGAEALSKIKEASPDLVLLDIKMPKMDGLKTLDKIKASYKNLPVVMVTGYDSMETAKDAINRGAADYVVKPFDSERVKKIAERLIG